MSSPHPETEGPSGSRTGLLRAARIPIALLWLVAAGSFLWPSGPGVASILRLVFWALLAVHAAECVVLFPALRRSGRPLAGELLGVLLFGVVHYGLLRAEQEAASAA